MVFTDFHRSNIANLLLEIAFIVTLYFSERCGLGGGAHYVTKTCEHNSVECNCT